jgi:translation initiation factor IF-3
LSRPTFRRRFQRAPRIRTNERIRVREVRLVDAEGEQVGIFPTRKALEMAKAHGLDLVEVAAKARPPVCRICDFGKYKYEQAKKEKEQKKNKIVIKIKEIQLRPFTDPHDYQYKLQHAIDFLCEEMKVKVFLRFRGRENAHKEFGFETMQKFVGDLSPYGKPDTQPRKAGRGISVMLAPLTPSKRKKNPNPKKHRHDDDTQESSGQDSKDNGEQAPENLNTAFADLDLQEEKQA